MRFDPSKPFAELFGEVPFEGAKYEQGGKYFKANGEEAKNEAEPISAPEPEKLEEMTKDDLLRYALNVYNKKLDKRRTWDAILQQVKDLQPE